jgi:hypothetical protein
MYTVTRLTARNVENSKFSLVIDAHILVIYVVILARKSTKLQAI